MRLRRQPKMDTIFFLVDRRQIRLEYCRSVYLPDATTRAQTEKASIKFSRISTRNCTKRDRENKAKHNLIDKRLYTRSNTIVEQLFSSKHSHCYMSLCGLGQETDDSLRSRQRIYICEKTNCHPFSVLTTHSHAPIRSFTRTNLNNVSIDVIDIN